MRHWQPVPATEPEDAPTGRIPDHSSDRISGHSQGDEARQHRWISAHWFAGIRGVEVEFPSELTTDDVEDRGPAPHPPLHRTAKRARGRIGDACLVPARSRHIY